MSKSNEDAVPPSYPYTWSKVSDLPLQDFLNKYKPSMVQNDGTKPWIWVQSTEPLKKDGEVERAVEEASATLKEFMDKIEAIKNDASIPIRSNKKTAIKSKKEVREQVQTEATKSLQEISAKYQYVSGKWLIFAPSDKIDMIWSNLATSLVSGPLASTPVYLAKVSTSPEQDTSNYQHIICLYMPDVYDKDSVIEVMRILLRNHGLNLSGVKSNLYTAIGIDSKHASGIQSTIWKNSVLMKDTESKELKDAFFADLASSKAPLESKKESERKDGPTDKPKPKRKQANDDLFASDSEDIGEEEPKRKKELQAKKASAIVKRKPANEDNSDDEEARPKKKRSA